MNDDKKKLAERVLKLFSLGDLTRNQSEAEAQLAITKARELMVQYAITAADLESLGTAKAKKVAHIITQTPVYTLKQRFALYDDYVAAAVCAITDTDNYIRNFWTTGGRRYWQRVFVGTDVDVAVAKELFLVMLDGIRQSARRTYGGGWSKRHTDYCLGYSTKLVLRARVAYQKSIEAGDAASVALAIVQDKKAARDVFQEKLKLKPRKTRTIVLDGKAWSQGEADGAVVDLSDPTRGLK